MLMIHISTSLLYILINPFYVEENKLLKFKDVLLYLEENCVWRSTNLLVNIVLRPSFWHPSQHVAWSPDISKLTFIRSSEITFRNGRLKYSNIPSFLQTIEQFARMVMLTFGAIMIITNCREYQKHSCHFLAVSMSAYWPSTCLSSSYLIIQPI